MRSYFSNFQARYSNFISQLFVIKQKQFFPPPPPLRYVASRIVIVVLFTQINR